MCSLNWRQFDDHIGIVFSRDESLKRAKAELPRIFDDGNGQFIMPRDPVGNGSWLTANQYGLVYLLLNDYQGLLKPKSEDLISRGLLIRDLASCRNLAEVYDLVSCIDLNKSQPFHLVMLSKNSKLYWHYDGVKNKLETQPLPQQIHSSGDAEAAEIISLRQEYVSSLTIKNDDDLLALHRSHQPLPQKVLEQLQENDSNDMFKGKVGEKVTSLNYPICMHRADAKTQSLTHIVLTANKVAMKYWNGQPCSTDHYTYSELDVVDNNG